jgi:hypothetical protein
MLIQIENKLAEIKDILEKSNIQSVAQRSLPAWINYPKEHTNIFITTSRHLSRIQTSAFLNGILVGVGLTGLALSLMGKI